jgi:nucleotide-binding universal stress UspA family protein
MIKTILVRAAGDDTDNATYPDAFAVARMFGAHVDALHVAPDPLEVAVNASSDSGGASGVLLERLVEDMKTEIDQREREAQRIFLSACGGEGIQIADKAAGVTGASAQWHVEVGHGSSWIVTYGMMADLIVASRGNRGTEADARSTLETALLETGRPLLIPGAVRRLSAGVERVAIAWKPTPQAARAVAAALPLVTRAKTVTVLIVEEDAGRRDDSDRLLDYLGWHGVRPAVKRLAAAASDGPSALLAAAGDTSDFLVMGGYGHARLREWVFGGFTQRLLADSPIPVVIAH